MSETSVKKTAVRLNIPKEEERIMVAAALLKNGYPCRIVKAKPPNAAVTSSRTQVLLEVDNVEVIAWR